MANEVANPFGGSVALKNREDLAKRAAESAATGARGGAPDGSDYMNFSGKRGVYTIGQDKRVVDEDELWLLNVTSFEDGWVCWKGGKPVSTRMANIFGASYPIPAPNPDEMGPFDTNRGEGWAAAKGWVTKSLDNDQQGYFKINSISGVGEMASLLDEVSQRMASGGAYWPVFSYKTEEFEAQGYKNFKPIFDVYGWLDDDAMAVLAEDSDADIDELIASSASADTPAKITKKKDTAKGASDPAPEQEAKEPTKRRRRRAS